MWRKAGFKPYCSGRGRTLQLAPSMIPWFQSVLSLFARGSARKPARADVRSTPSRMLRATLNTR